MPKKISYSNVSLRVLIAAIFVLSTFAVITLSGNVAAIPTYSVSVTMNSPSQKELNPGKTVQFPFQVKNEGANDDDYYLNASIPAIWVSAGWTAYVTPTKTGTLTFGSTKSGTLTVTSPTNAS